MLRIFLIIILLITSNALSQEYAEFKNEMIKITADKNIETEKLNVKLVEGFGWNIILYDLFSENKIVENNFPKEKGIYTLSITYSESLMYSEIILYKTDPTNENLEFNFYKENDRIFCKIKSDYANELNKEIVMNEMGSELKEILNTINENKQ